MVNSMRWWMRRASHWRTSTQVVVLLIATLVASILLLTALNIRTHVQSAYDWRAALAVKEGQNIERLLAAAGGNIRSPQTLNRIQNVVADVGSIGGLLSFFFVDRDGLILAHSNPSAVGGRYRNQDIIQALDSGKVVMAQEQEEGFVRFDVAVPIKYSGSTMGAIEAQFSLASMSDEVESAQRDGLISALIVALALIPAAAFVVARLQRTLERMAITDGLSGLFDHRYFRLRLDEEIKRSARYGHRLSLIMFDVDGFKSYNDTFGHLVGDEAIRQIALILTDSIRAVDVPARYGGEEFTVILPETDIDRAHLVAERLRAAMTVFFEDGGSPGPLTASFGVAAYPADATSSDDLIRCADFALYHAKAMGKNCTCLYSTVARQAPLGATADTP